MFFFGLFVQSLMLFLLPKWQHLIALLMLCWILLFTSIPMFFLVPMLLFSILLHFLFYRVNSANFLSTSYWSHWFVLILCLLFLTQYLENPYMHNLENVLLIVGWYIGGWHLGFFSARKILQLQLQPQPQPQLQPQLPLPLPLQMDSGRNFRFLSYAFVRKTRSFFASFGDGRFLGLGNVIAIMYMIWVLLLAGFLSISFLLFQFDFWEARMFLTTFGQYGWYWVHNLNLDILFLVSGGICFVLAFSVSVWMNVQKNKKKKTKTKNVQQDGNEMTLSNSIGKQLRKQFLESISLFFLFLIAGFILQNVFVLCLSGFALGYVLVDARTVGKKNRKTITKNRG